jgi:hypothetical protein
MRVITIPSAPNGSIGIVGNHLEQTGFALVDSVSGTEIFCVSKDRDDFKAWVYAISCQLTGSSTKQLDDCVVKEHQDIEPPQANSLESNGSVEASGVIISASDSFIPDIVPDAQVLTNQLPDSSPDDDVDDMDMMDTISLSGSDDNPSALELDNAADVCHEQLESPQAEQHVSTPVAQHDVVKPKASTIPSTRDLIKTSRFATSKLNSALKSAKEKGRDSVQNRAELGQKLSGLRQNANMKMSQFSTVVKTSVQEHSRVDPRAVKQVDPALNSGLETLGESQVLDFPNNSVQPNRQEQMKKKLASLDQSMSTTMRRLKLDEKLNNISTALRHAASEGQVVARQISNTGSVSQLKSSEQRQMKSIKMDARETFSSHSDLPVRVKSIKAGNPLVLHSDSYLTEKSQSLSKIKGDWYIGVQVHNEYEVPIGMPFSEVHSETVQSTSGDSGRKQMKFKITSTEVGTGMSESVFKSLSDVLIFNALISEALSSYDCAAQVAYKEETEGVESMEGFHKLTSIEKLRVCGSMLQGILDASNLSGSTSIQNGHCKFYFTAK